MNELDQAIKAATERLPSMTQEQLEQLSLNVRAILAAYRSLRSQGELPESAVKAMTDVVDDRLMAQIVQDLKSAGNTVPGWMPPPKPDLEAVLKPEEPKDETPSWQRSEKPRGWVDPPSLSNPPGVEICDRLMDVQDALDKRNLERRLRGDG
jgi:hypothetical protein